MELVCRLKRGHAGDEEPAELPGPGCRPAAVASWVCGEARRLLLTALTWEIVTKYRLSTAPPPLPPLSLCHT